MSQVKTELWRLISSGFHTSIIATMDGISSADTRRLLWEDQVFHKKVKLDAATSMLYVVADSAIGELMSMIDQPTYSPSLRDDLIFPLNASDNSGASLSADTISGLENYVYSWDYENFSFVGNLTSHSTPAAGVYVIVPGLDDGSGVPSVLHYPSSFLTLT